MKNILKALRSPVKKKIITFFHENPYSVDSVRGISTWLNIDPKVVKKVLEELVKDGILIAHRGRTTTGYAYTQDKEILEYIETCLTSKHEKRDSD
ncbi:MAG: winged helix-turn-helix domain-containing protein [Candidatus Omnitrophota bacterium]